MGLLLDSATVTPPEGAGPDSDTVQVEAPGVVMVPGEQFTLLGTVRTVRLSVVLWLWPFSVAVMVAVWLIPTVPLDTVNVAVLWPAATTTLGKTGKVALLLTSMTVTALEAASLSDTVQAALVLVPKVDGEQDTDVSWAGALAARVKL